MTKNRAMAVGAAAVLVVLMAVLAADVRPPVAPRAAPAPVPIRVVLFRGDGVGTSPVGQEESLAMAPFNGEMTEAAGDRMVGLFTPLDNWSTHVRLAGSARSAEVETVARSAARSTGWTVVVEYMDTPTLAEMLAAVARHSAELRTVAGVGGADVSETTSRVMVDVAPGTTDPGDVLTLATRLFGPEGISVGVNLVDTRYVVPMT
jgi:hypothetical protein